MRLLFPFPCAALAQNDKPQPEITPEVVRQYSRFDVFECVEYVEEGECESCISRACDIDVGAVKVVGRFFTVYGLAQGRAYALWDGSLNQVVSIASNLLAQCASVRFVNINGEKLLF